MVVSGGEDADGGASEDASSLQSLTFRARAALKALSDGRIRTVGDLNAVSDLQQRLTDLVTKFSLLGDGIDLREVQESVVEHAAMYAKSREVFGGMLQLVFCLDTIRTWLEQRDDVVRDALVELGRLRHECQDGVNRISEMSTEVKALESTEASPTHANMDMLDKAVGRVSAMSTASGMQSSPAQDVKMFNVDLQALEMEAADETRKRLQDLEQENVELRNRLAEATAEAAAACTAAETAKQAAEESAAAAAEAAQRHQALLAALPTLSSPEPTPESSALVVLEKLEPMLVALPVGRVPGMSELQEEACETYGRLRSLLIKAAAGVAVEDTPDVPLPSPQLALGPSSIGFVPSNPMPPLYSWRSTSAGTTSEEQPDTWRPATLISDPMRGIGGEYNFGRGSGTLNNSGGRPPPWLQEGHGGLLRVNRLC